MPWWAWVVVFGLVGVVLTRKWNPISRTAAAHEIGRRYAVLIHFWRVWTILAAIAISVVGVLIAARPGPHEATAPARAAKPAPTQATPTHAPSPTASPAASPSPAASASPVAVPSGEGHFPGPIFLVLLIAVGMGAALTVWSLRRRDDPDRWLAMAGPDLLDDETSDDDADGWPPGSGPGRTNTDTEDDDDDTDGGYDLGPVVAAAEETNRGYTTGPGGGGVVGAGAVRGVSHRGRRLPRRR